MRQSIILMQFTIFFGLTICALIGCKREQPDNNSREKDIIQNQSLTKQEIINIAKREVEDNFSGTTELSVYYDVNNIECAKLFKESDPNLFQNDFQAILFYKKQFIPTPMGEVWICVDKKTGVVLRLYGYWKPK